MFGRKLNPMTEQIIGAALAVHRGLGSGLRERTYERALMIEFRERGLNFHNQFSVPMVYRDRTIDRYRLDFLIEEQVVLEIKSVGRMDPAWEAQILAYLRATSKRVGLIINFNQRFLKDGIRRFVL